MQVYRIRYCSLYEYRYMQRATLKIQGTITFMVYLLAGKRHKPRTSTTSIFFCTYSYHFFFLSPFGDATTSWYTRIAIHKLAAASAMHRRSNHPNRD
jgi:hypothetical protein